MMSSAPVNPRQLEADKNHVMAKIEGLMIKYGPPYLGRIKDVLVKFINLVKLPPSSPSAQLAILGDHFSAIPLFKDADDSIQPLLLSNRPAYKRLWNGRMFVDADHPTVSPPNWPGKVAGVEVFAFREPRMKTPGRRSVTEEVKETGKEVVGGGNTQTRVDNRKEGVEAEAEDRERERRMLMAMFGRELMLATMDAEDTGDVKDKGKGKGTAASGSAPPPEIRTNDNDMENDSAIASDAATVGSDTHTEAPKTPKKKNKKRRKNKGKAQAQLFHEMEKDAADMQKDDSGTKEDLDDATVATPATVKHVHWAPDISSGTTKTAAGTTEDDQAIVADSPTSEEADNRAAGVQRVPDIRGEPQSL